MGTESEQSPVAGDVLPKQVDVLVAGSGAAGLTAALTVASRGLSTLLVEAGEHWGGTTALGGGRVWVPASSGEDVDAARQYLNGVFGGEHRVMIDAFVSSAMTMTRFVETHSPHRFVRCPDYPDYHPDLPGWSAGGRAHDVAPVHLGGLCAESADTLLPPGYLPITHAEWEEWRFPSRFDWRLIEARRREGVLTNGAGLIAALVDGAVRAGAQLVKPLSLLDVDASRSAPIVATVGGNGSESTVMAGALILATGGFDADPDLRATYLHPAVSASAGAPTNSGIALRLALESRLTVENLSEGWWTPVVQVPGDEVDGRPYPRALVRERGVPHQIVVNRAGVRFVDEAVPYHEFVMAMLREDRGSYPNREAWIVFDSQFRSKYPFPGLTPTGAVPTHIVSDESLESLASRLGIDATLTETVRRWNEYCRTGVDPDFGRGSTLYDRYYGDPDSESNPNFGTIEQPPFYAAEVLSGVVGSKGGPVTNEHGQVLDTEGRPRPGWYAVGNASATWTGDSYPGPGATLGIGMTFAHRAGLDAIRFLTANDSM